jgi:hypothetical protein
MQKWINKRDFVWASTDAQRGLPAAAALRKRGFVHRDIEPAEHAVAPGELMPRHSLILSVLEKTAESRASRISCLHITVWYTTLALTGHLTLLVSKIYWQLAC